MPTYTFIGGGSSTTSIYYDGAYALATPLKGELRLGSPLKYPILELWRRAALEMCTEGIPTENPRTRQRIVIVFAHEAGLAPMFFDLAKTTAAGLGGKYALKRRVALVDDDLRAMFALCEPAMNELASAGVPAQFREMLRARVISASKLDRTPGLCAAVYLACLLAVDSEGTL